MSSPNTSSQNSTRGGLPRRPKPPSTQDTAFFWDQANRHQLVIQRCCGCRTLRHPPMPVCPRCHSFDWDFVPSPGKGVLFSFTTVHAPLVESFDRPYGVGIVELEEKIRLVAVLQDGPTPWRIGMRVKVDFFDCEGGFALPVICPEAA